MLRRLLGAAAGAGVLLVVPVSFDAAEPGGVPAPTVSDLACSEKADCCFELNSVCLAGGDPQIDRREVKGGSCR